MSSPAIILTSEFVMSHKEGAIDYLDRDDRKMNKDKQGTSHLENEAHDILSLDAFKQLDESEFSHYLNYLSRQRGLENNSFHTSEGKLELLAVTHKIDSLETSLSNETKQAPHF